MPNDKVLSTLSLAKKAGQLESGALSTKKAVQEKRARLVIVAGDASENTKKEMKNMTAFYGIPIYFYSGKDDLGRSIGKEYRSMVAITHPGFADSVEEQLKDESQRNREG